MITLTVVAIQIFLNKAISFVSNGLNQAIKR